MKDTFEFDPDKWLGNRSLRGCSTGARGLWVDLLCLMHPEGGYLTINGQPIDDAKLSRLIGEPVKSIRSWIKELGEAGVFDVSSDGRMFSSRMVKKASFVANAKKHGERGQQAKRENPDSPAKRLPTSPPPEYRMEEVSDTPPPRPKKGDKVTIEGLEGQRVLGEEITNRPKAKKVAPPAKKASAAPWWKSPAGWVRYGAGQAMSMKSDEEFEDFQCRLAARIPPGRHLEELSSGQLRMVEAMRPKDPNAKPD